MGGGDHTDVNHDTLIAADALKDALLQHAQKHYLGLRRKLAHFIQKDGPLVSDLKAAKSMAARACKGSLFMAEQLAGNDARGERRTIHLDHRMITTWAELMNSAGHQFFPGAGLAKNQNRAVGVRDLLDGQPNRLHLLAFTSQRSKVALGLNFSAQISRLPLEPLKLQHALLQFGNAAIPCAATLAGRIVHGDILME